MNCFYLLKKASNILKENFVKNPHLDSEIILANVIETSRENLLLNLNRKINNKELNRFNFLVERRRRKEPMAYIIGKKEFWKTEFLVNKSVLIPRPDTEILVEKALKLIPKNKEIQILDIGTGSGCILISLLKERKKCIGTGLDISKESINVAKINAKIQHLENRIRLVHSDIDNFFHRKYDLIISNPPYIKKIFLNKLEEDVVNYEPNVALYGGSDGYSRINRVIFKSSELIKKNGKLIIEIDDSQVFKTSKVLKQNGFYINEILKDLNKKNRCIVSTKK